VKCNTSLAETLINNKNKEITELENIYKSKITFIFDNLFSLHEPLVEIQGIITNTNDENNVIKKNKSKKKIAKKKTRVIKKITDVKDKGKIKYIKKDMKDDKKTNEKDTKSIQEEISKKKNEELKADDKTGWWS